LFVRIEPPRDEDMGEVPVECRRDLHRSAVIDSVSDFRFLRVLRTVSSSVSVECSFLHHPHGVRLLHRSGIGTGGRGPRLALICTYVT
jgi:hypothetical protein